MLDLWLHERNYGTFLENICHSITYNTCVYTHTQTYIPGQVKLGTGRIEFKVSQRILNLPPQGSQ